MLLHDIKLTNLLSFGPDGMELELRPLNVLIGPNGSGKSNFLAAISVLQAAPDDVAKPIREGGGVQDWIWKGEPDAMAQILVGAMEENDVELRHILEFGQSSGRFSIHDELVCRCDVSDWAKSPNTKRPTLLDSLSFHVPPDRRIKGGSRMDIPLKDFNQSLNKSILALQRGPEYPEITRLAYAYQAIRMYRNWSIGEGTEVRRPQKADLPNDFLEPDLANLALVLSRLSSTPQGRQPILDGLKQIYDGIEDYGVSVEGGTVQVFFHESGLKQRVPATRLSDGTLRYLCLLAILCDPNPPPLVCIEEPELGLHPDIIPTLAKLLKEASEQTQLIVTTHSDLLVDAFHDEPDAIVVCDKEKNGTTMKRLDAKALEAWLKKYRLGELWIKGKIGGVRW